MKSGSKLCFILTTEEQLLVAQHIYKLFNQVVKGHISAVFPCKQLILLTAQNIVDKWKINWGKRDWRYWKRRLYTSSVLYLTTTVTIKHYLLITIVSWWSQKICHFFCSVDFLCHIIRGWSWVASPQWSIVLVKMMFCRSSY